MKYVLFVLRGLLVGALLGVIVTWLIDLNKRSSERIHSRVRVALHLTEKCGPYRDLAGLKCALDLIEARLVEED